MDLQEQQDREDLLVVEPLEVPEDPNEEIQATQQDLNNPELQEHHQPSLNCEVEHELLHHYEKIEKMMKMMKQIKNKPFPRFKPEFEITFYNYNTELDLALHDHDRVDILSTSRRLSQSCYVYRIKNQNTIQMDILDKKDAEIGILPHQNAEILFQIRLQGSGFDIGKKFYRIIPQEITKFEEKWHTSRRLDMRLYKSIRQKGNYRDRFCFHRLEKGDQIRFGLQTYRVIELELKPPAIRRQIPPVQKRQVEQLNNSSRHEKLSQSQVPICKICLSPDYTTQDPLLTPCNCRGTCKNVHLNCLKTWLNSNLVKEPSKLVDSFKWTKMECEICKVTYPMKLLHNEKLLHLIDYPVPDEPYVVFERMRSGCRKQILVVKGTVLPVHVGRNLDCEFKVDVNTVSRIHAVIEFRNGLFYLKDLESKYGTLVRINEPMRVQENLKIQVGDTLMRFDSVDQRKAKDYTWKYN